MSCPKRLRRKIRKELDLFTKDHCWGRGTWLPRKLRKVRPYTDAEAKLLWEIRATAIEAGRLRMVARGLYQYAEPGELTPEQEDDFAVIKARNWAEQQAAIAK